MRHYYLLFLCLLLATASVAQEKAPKRKKNNAAYNKQNKENEKFLQKQWYLGFKAGPNLSSAKVEKTYSIVAPTNYEPSAIAKQYDNFKLVGSQATIEVTFYFKGVSLSFQPTYQHSRFAYSNNYFWTAANAETSSDNEVTMQYYQEQKVNHALLPLIVKYEFMTGRLRPYAQIGIYSALLLDATKSVEISGVDNAAGGENEFKSESITVGAKDLFAKSHWGLIGGVGLNYNLGNNVRLNFDVMYKHGMSNIVSTENRYGSDRLAGVGDTMDDLTLDNLSVSVGCLFPLRFLSSGFKTLDRK